MIGVYIGAACVGVGIAVLETYLEYRQDKKMEELNKNIVSLCGSLERKLNQMPPDELRKRLKIVE